MDQPVDLLVLGGGTAGIVGSKTAAGLGARTVLVEQARTGGDCLWTGCVPSKTILAAAAQAAADRSAAGMEPDFTQVRSRIRTAISTIEPEDSPAALEAAGVTVVSGTARFTAPGTAVVAGEVIRFRQALIATGSSPAVPPIPGLQGAEYVTSETIWDLQQLPGRLVVIGGGPLACELGQAFARLGSRVTVLARSGLLPKEDRDAARLVTASLERDGAAILEHDAVEEIHHSDASGTMVLTSAGRRLEADVLLVATGRTPHTPALGLQSVGVECDESGHVLVDHSMRSSNSSIWAAGDVTAHPKFTHLAGVHAATAASNAILGLRRRVSSTVPRVTYTSPEVAAVGVTEASQPGLRVSTVSLKDTDRAVTEGSSEGFVRLVLGKRGRILGGTIVGPRAGESLGELTLAVSKKMSALELAGITHAYPTYNDALWNAAIAHARTGLDSQFAKLLTGTLAGAVRHHQERRRRQRSA